MKGWRKLAGAALAIVLTACAGNRSAEDADAPQEQVRVTVQNDGAIPTQVRVSLVTDAGSSLRVGSMSTLGTEMLTLTAPAIGGTYRLRAEGGTRYNLLSPPVTLRGNEHILWNMQLNRVTIEEF